MNKEEFYKELKKINIELSDLQKEQLQSYCDYLLETNKNVNLTAIKEPDQVYLKHFYDSLTITEVIDLKEVGNVLDIGTGAGFPGMVLKIVFPNLKLTLLDSNNKKIEFLKQLAEKIGINDIEFIHGRAEEFITNRRESYDLVTARAVSNMQILSEICLPYVKLNEYFIPLKGSNEEEIKEAETAITILGGQIEFIKKLELPKDEGTRNIIKVKKINETDKKYPRRYDKIIKYPLKK